MDSVQFFEVLHSLRRENTWVTDHDVKEIVRMSAVRHIHFELCDQATLVLLAAHSHAKTSQMVRSDFEGRVLT
jgi:hypothetical protein